MRHSLVALVALHSPSVVEANASIHLTLRVNPLTLARLSKAGAHKSLPISTQQPRFYPLLSPSSTSAFSHLQHFLGILHQCPFTTRSMASTSVLDTYELLERILLHLPLRTLVLSQRVNKAWSDVFHRSQGIQCACFLKAASSPLNLREQPAKEDREFGPLQYVDDKGELAGPPILNPFTIM